MNFNAKTNKTPNGSSQSQSTRSIGPLLRILQINVEGSSRAKCEYLSKIATEHHADIIAIQEHHVGDIAHFNNRLKISGFSLVAYTTSKTYGSAVFTKEGLKNIQICSISQVNNIESIVIKVNGTSITSLYKPPKHSWDSQPILCQPHPSIYIGDFNSHHTMWGYRENDKNGDAITEWADLHNPFLVFNPKDKGTFHSGRWNTDTNPDLCFVSTDEYDQPLPTSRKVLNIFPHSKHRPTLLTVGLKVDIPYSLPKPRWNFQKADWHSFSAQVDANIRWFPPILENFPRFVGVIKGSAKRCIPRGYRKEYIPCWSKETEALYHDFQKTGNPQTATEILRSLDDGRRQKWIQTTESMNFTHSSRTSWAVLRRLGSNEAVPPEPPKVDPNLVARRLKSISKSSTTCKSFTHKIKKELRVQLKQNSLNESFQPFTSEELEIGIQKIKSGKAAGADGIYPEFLKNLGKRAKAWLLAFYNNALKKGQIPAGFNKSQIICLLKPGKCADDPANYRPISLLNTSYKLLERLIYNRIAQTINKIVPHEQAGFRENRNCCDQVTALTSFIEAGFQKRQKTAAAFVDLTAAYDTVWIKGLLFKLNRVLPCKKTFNLIQKMLTGRKFRVTLGFRNSRQYFVNDGLPQGSVLAPLLFNLYISDIPPTKSRKFMYADDLALATQHPDLQAGEHVLTEDLSVLQDYYEKWRLRPNPNKTEVAAFHLSNIESTKELSVKFCGKTLRHNGNPKYLGVTLDRSLTYKQHLTKVGLKLKTRNNIVRKLAGTTWGADARTLRTTSLALVYSSAEFCAPVWKNSRHTKIVDAQLNENMRIITGTLKSTPIPWLPVLSNIAPPSIRRQAAAYKQWCKSTNLEYPDEETKLLLLNPPLTRLKSRHPIWNDFPDCTYFSVEEEWTSYWENLNLTNKHLIDIPYVQPTGAELPRKLWSRLNRIRTGQTRCAYTMHKWNIVTSAACNCGAPSQTVSHIIESCPVRRFQGDLYEINKATPAALDWLRTLDVNL